MGKIMEAIFCAAYLVVTCILGIKIIKNSKNGKKNKELLYYGVMTLILVGGDSFHLVPRIMAAIDKAGDYKAAMGIGTLVTSITMTVFYLIMYCFFEIHYGRKNRALMVMMTALAVARIALCLMPQNDWTGDSPVIWGIYRNIPFTVMGIIMVALFFKEREDQLYKYMWIAILLSFAFYIPVVLWSDVNKMVGMLMMPKTCMYVWMVAMGYKQGKK